MPKVPDMGITPYYRRGPVTIYHGDCLNLILSVGLDEVDLVMTDPPYGISHGCNFQERGRDLWAKNRDFRDVEGDRWPFDPSWLLETGLPLVLWGGNHYADKLPPSGGWLVWDKERPEDLDQSTCELAWTNCVKGVRRFRHLWNGCIKASERGESLHPTQKPVALMRWVLGLRWLRGKQSVLDPFMGSGPVGVACAQLGRRYVGIEVDEGYCEVAASRVDACMDDEEAYWASESGRARRRLGRPRPRVEDA